jgi:hypothetical protein
LIAKASDPLIPEATDSFRQVFWLVLFFAAFPSSTEDSGSEAKKFASRARTYSDGFAPDFDGIPFSPQLTLEYLNNYHYYYFIIITFSKSLSTRRGNL